MSRSAIGLYARRSLRAFGMRRKHFQEALLTNPTIYIVTSCPWEFRSSEGEFGFATCLATSAVGEGGDGMMEFDSLAPRSLTPAERQADNHVEVVFMGWR